MRNVQIGETDELQYFIKKRYTMFPRQDVRYFQNSDCFALFYLFPITISMILSAFPNKKSMFGLIKYIWGTY